MSAAVTFVSRKSAVPANVFASIAGPRPLTPSPANRATSIGAVGTASSRTRAAGAWTMREAYHLFRQTASAGSPSFSIAGRMAS